MPKPRAKTAAPPPRSWKRKRPKTSDRWAARRRPSIRIIAVRLLKQPLTIPRMGRSRSTAANRTSSSYAPLHRISTSSTSHIRSRSCVTLRRPTRVRTLLSCSSRAKRWVHEGEGGERKVSALVVVGQYLLVSFVKICSPGATEAFVKRDSTELHDSLQNAGC